ncbi:MAG: hypothetical protein J6M05_02260 [Cardiobacteriaceae bacterium]|nr:hypothetical protein [Cardiobacteriaceae bacterium]
MTIYQTDVIDMIATIGNKVELVITDHLEWTGKTEEDLEHLRLLDAKVIKYIASYQSGELLRKKPEIKDKKVTIQIIGLHCPNKRGAKFISDARDYLSKNCPEITLEFVWSAYAEC